jgi:hypothetical protein
MKERKRQNLIEQKETQSNKTFLEAFSPFFCWAPSHGQPGWPALALTTSLGIGQLFSGVTGAERDVT